MPATFPNARWAALVWFALWLPAYWHYWGWRNFLQLCDIAVILTVVGFWRGGALLFSSQILGVMLVSIFWTADAGWRLLLGRHLMGGTEYLWDANFPLWLRLLSLYHIALPLALLWALRRTGYDPRGWKLEAAIAAVAMTAARILSDPAQNYNFAFRDPFFAREWGPAPVHVLFIWLVTISVAYYPVYLLLRKLYPRPTDSSH